MAERRLAKRRLRRLPLDPLLIDANLVFLGTAPRLLVANPETRLTAVLRKSFRRERLDLEIRGVYEVSRGSWLAFPRLSYLVRDGLRVRVGYLATGGAQDSIIGQYRSNDEVVLQARYSF